MKSLFDHLGEGEEGGKPKKKKGTGVGLIGESKVEELTKKYPSEPDPINEWCSGGIEM